MAVAPLPGRERLTFESARAYGPDLFILNRSANKPLSDSRVFKRQDFRTDWPRSKSSEIVQIGVGFLDVFIANSRRGGRVSLCIVLSLELTVGYFLKSRKTRVSNRPKSADTNLNFGVAASVREAVKVLTREVHNFQRNNSDERGVGYLRLQSLLIQPGKHSNSSLDFVCHFRCFAWRSAARLWSVDSALCGQHHGLAGPRMGHFRIMWDRYGKWIAPGLVATLLVAAILYLRSQN